MEKKLRVASRYPFEMFGVECNKGWHPLVERTLNDLYASGIKMEEILQVKEKFGGLRIYLSRYTDEADQIIKKAEEEALHTCEVCGTQQDVAMRSPRGWMSTQCETCYNKKKE